MDPMKTWQIVFVYRRETDELIYDYLEADTLADAVDQARDLLIEWNDGNDEPASYVTIKPVLLMDAYLVYMDRIEKIA